MENQNSQGDTPSRDSSISLEDHNGRFPRLSRSDLYTAHQQQRTAYGPRMEEPFLMIPLDFPGTYSANDPSAAEEHSGASGTSSSLSVLRLERYLAEEQCHERFSLGVPALGSNRATVKKYLDEIIHNIDRNDASQAGATRGTATDCDERGPRRSPTCSMSASPGETSELAETHDKQASADSESHLDLEEGLETGQILMRDRTKGHERHERHDRWRVGKRARVKRNIRQRRRRGESHKDKAP